MADSALRSNSAGESAAVDWQAIDEYVAAYESALDGRNAPMADFLPPAESPLRLPVLAEFVRVAMERGWEAGSPQKLDVFLDEFAELREARDLLRDVAFEEYRLRRAAGEAAAPEDYAARYGVDVSSWPRFAGSAPNVSRGDRYARPLGGPFDDQDPRLP